MQKVATVEVLWKCHAVLSNPTSTHKYMNSKKLKSENDSNWNINYKR